MPRQTAKPSDVTAPRRFAVLRRQLPFAAVFTAVIAALMLAELERVASATRRALTSRLPELSPVR